MMDVQRVGEEPGNQVVYKCLGLAADPPHTKL